jgi:hypothetical protein
MAQAISAESVLEATRCLVPEVERRTGGKLA